MQSRLLSEKIFFLLSIIKKIEVKLHKIKREQTCTEQKNVNKAGSLLIQAC
jgi:hypothetical protein